MTDDLTREIETENGGVHFLTQAVQK